MKTITSRENSHIKEFVKLSSDKKYRNQESLFTIEGLKLAKEAFDSGVSITKLFITRELFNKNQKEWEPIINSVPDAYCIPEEIGRKLSDTKNPQGIFCIAKKLDKVFCIDTIYNKGYFLVLCDISDPGNLGTIFRTGEALGIDGIVMTSTCCDPYSPKAVRSAMGSLFRVPFWITKDILAQTQEWNRQGIQTCAAVVGENACAVQEFVFSERAALYIGNEANGLKKEIQNACSQKVTITMRGAAESLNASMAAGILMWEMLKQK